MKNGPNGLVRMDSVCVGGCVCGGVCVRLAQRGVHNDEVCVGEEVMMSARFQLLTVFSLSACVRL